MNFQEAKDKFVHTWGTLSTQWGINRTMSQIHALLLLSPRSMNADEIMEELQISRGNVNMNLRELMNWGLIYKQLLPGERKEYFIAEKDHWKVMRQISKERRKRELTPLVESLEDIRKNFIAQTNEENNMLELVDGFSTLANLADDTLNKIERTEENWLVNNFIKIFS